MSNHLGANVKRYKRINKYNNIKIIILCININFYVTSIKSACKINSDRFGNT